MNRPKRLSASFVRTVNVPGRYGDGRGGHGLSLLVKPASVGGFSKSWAQRIRANGKPTNVGLGSYPVVTLAEARAKALENRRAVAQGRDPRRGVGVPTFEEAAETVIGIHRGSWQDGGKTEKQWRASLRDYAMPRLGRKRVDTITAADVMAVLLADGFWYAKPETARRTRRRIGAVMKWAVAQGYRDDNPAGDAIGSALPKNNGPRTGHAALPHAKVGAALANVRESEGWPAAKLCLEFATLCAVRSGEARGARWSEIDFETATWTVPPERSKTNRPHRVPLSQRAVEVVTAARKISADGALVFTSPRGKQLTDRALSQLLRELDLAGTVHGMRSAYRSWAAEVGVSREIAEQALGHVVGGVEGAYQRSDLLEARRAIMEQWATHISVV